MRGVKGLLAALALAAAPAVAEARTEQVTVHGVSLEGNLLRNSPDRAVFVVLPKDYDAQPARHYPVVYLLHGYLMTAADFIALAKVEDAAQDGGAILVVPDAFTKFGGSFYSSSIATGDFEDFIAQDLVTYVDEHYRTIADRSARGLAGHSMGGYGTLRIGMKHPEVFSALYAMSPCCLAPRTVEPAEGRAMEAMKFDQLMQADSAVTMHFAAAAAWSPGPEKPPFFIDMPTAKGVPDPQVMARWAANSPLAMLPQYLPALGRMNAIGMDVGSEDPLLAEDQAMQDALERFGVTHEWTVYQGDHLSGVAGDLRDTVLPFFARNLASATR